MVCADSFDAVAADVDLLSGPELSDQNVRVGGPDAVLAGEHLCLLALGFEDKVAGVDMRVDIALFGVVGAGFGQSFAVAAVLLFGRPATFNVHAHDDGVVVAGDALALVVSLLFPSGLRGVVVGGWRLAEPAHPSQAFFAAGQGNETQSVREDFVLDQRGVAEDEDILNGESGHFGDQNAAEGVCDAGVDAD